MLANPRICAAISFLGRYMLSANPPHSDEGKLSIIKGLLRKAVGLRAVCIFRVNVSRVLMDAFIEMTARIPFQFTLYMSMYPPGTGPTPNLSLPISNLHLASSAADPSIDFYHPMLCASAATLTELSMVTNGDRLMKLVGIDLPFLHNLTMFIHSENEVSAMNTSAFITAQRMIRKLYLMVHSRRAPCTTYKNSMPQPNWLSSSYLGDQ